MSSKLRFLFLVTLSACTVAIASESEVGYPKLNFLREIGVPINTTIDPPLDLSESNSSHCGVHAAYIVLRLLGHRQDYASFLQTHSVADPRGLSMTEVQSLLEAEGISSESREVSPSSLPNLSVPFIAREVSEVDGQHHYNVVLSYDDRFDSFSVMSTDTFSIGVRPADALNRSYAGQVIVLSDGFQDLTWRNRFSVAIAIAGVAAAIYQLVRRSIIWRDAS